MRSNQLPSEEYQIIAHKCHTQPPSSACFCPSLERSDCIKYLGVLLDQTLTFKAHLDLLSCRLRKMIYIFSNLKHIAKRKIIKTVYFALCHSLLEYCITTWGGAAKCHLLAAERAQRVLLKVAAGLPYLFPTAELHKVWNILSVRQTYILRTILLKHSQLIYDPILEEKRRNTKVCIVPLLRTSFSQHFFQFLGPFLYNRINHLLHIYPLVKSTCKLTVSKYLISLDYDDTENLLCPTR